MIFPERNKALAPPIRNVRCTRCSRLFPARPKKTLAFTRASQLDLKCPTCRELVAKVAAEIAASVR